MHKILTLTATAIALTTTPALAQSWTGYYGGFQLGYANVDTTPGGDGDGIIGGIVGGYDYDLGNNWVVGIGVDYDIADVSIGAVDIEEIFRAKFRAGYIVGDGLIYGTGGYAWADTNIIGDDDGYFIGGGYEHRVSQDFSVGAELLYHDFSTFNTLGADIEATTFQIRGVYRF